MRTSVLLFTLSAMSSLTFAALAQSPVSGTQRLVNAFDTLDAAAQQHVFDQEPLTKAAHVLRTEIENIWDDSLGGAGGYASIALNDDAVVLRWKGALPSQLQEALLKARGIAPVRHETALYSRIELKAAARRIGEFVEAQQREGYPYHAVYVADDSKIQVAVKPGADRGRATNALPYVNVPVEVISEVPAQAISRNNSWAPWKGGASILTRRSGSYDTRSRCTSGFGVAYGGSRYLLTAAHCGTWPDYFVDGTVEYIGHANAEDWRLDLLLIGPLNANHQVYWGDTSSPGWVANVGSWDWVWVNDWLCQSGYPSARVTGNAVCNLRAANLWAERVWICDSDNDCFWIQDLVAADKIGGDGIAARVGDSGGPVVSVDSNGRLVAKGTAAACVFTGNRCFRLLMQDFGTAQRRFPGLQPLTGW